MPSCKNCKWSEPYFRGLLCHWTNNHIIKAIPPYIKIDTSECYPYQLDDKDLGDRCLVFEAAQQSVLAPCACGDDLFAVNPDGNCAWCKSPRN